MCHYINCLYMMKDAWIVLSTCLSIYVSIYTLSIHDKRRLDCPVYLSIYICVYIYLVYTRWKTPGLSCLPVYLYMCLYIPCIYMMKDAWTVLSNCLSTYVSIYTLSIHDERRLDCPGWSRTTIVVLNWFSLYSWFH